MKLKKFCIIAIIFCITSTPTYTQNSNSFLFKPTTKIAGFMTTRTDDVVRVQNVTFSPELFTKKKQLLGQIFGETITIIQDEHKPADDRNLIYGKIREAKGENYVIITRANNIYACNILKDDKLYQIRWSGNGVYQLRQIDQSRFPPEAESLLPEGIKNIALEMLPCANLDPEDYIDVMVAYTDDARSAAGGKDAIEAEILLAVHETNLAYLNSQVTQRIRLVHLVEVNYAESGVASTDLVRLRTSTDGIMDNIHPLRNTYFADVVVLITQTSNHCGVAYLLDPVSTAFEPYAFAIVKRSCATGYYSFAHELGHIMGCRHDCAQDAATTPYVYAHGHEYCAGTTKVRTVMAYNNCGSTRLPYFSNPNVYYPAPNNTIPAGTSTGACQANDAAVLNNTDLTVANFRCHSPNTSNVWMKDAWTDSGAQPDPLTASEYMWNSPYIWIRTAQDAGFLHQHEHQNPELGSSNWLYVKLHNGGSAASGNLKLYVADASVSLNWPSDWTLLPSATIPVTIPASSSKIVEYEWTNLPGAGHYCLLARWESATDPMAFTETADVNYNTRQNNNIVWRNLNIVDLAPDHQVVEVTLNYKPQKDSKLSIEFPDKFPHRSFIRNGKVTLRLERPRIPGQPEPPVQVVKGTGFKSLGNNIYEVTDFGKAVFNLPESNSKEPVKLLLTFRKPGPLPNEQYLVHVVQSVGKKIVGGVSYEIHNRNNLTQLPPKK